MLKVFLLLSFISIALCFFTEPRVSPSKVLVVYNLNYKGDEDFNGVQDSLQVAQYYMTKRSVPAQNIIGITDTFGDNLTEVKFQLFQPLIDKIDALGKYNKIPLQFSNHHSYRSKFT
jgi:hypothetical protein